MEVGQVEITSLEGGMAPFDADAVVVVRRDTRAGHFSMEQSERYCW